MKCDCNLCSWSYLVRFRSYFRSYWIPILMYMWETRKYHDTDCRKSYYMYHNSAIVHVSKNKLKLCGDSGCVMILFHTNIYYIIIINTTTWWGSTGAHMITIIAKYSWASYMWNYQCAVQFTKATILAGLEPILVKQRAIKFHWRPTLYSPL